MIIRNPRLQKQAGIVFMVAAGKGNKKARENPDKITKRY